MRYGRPAWGGQHCCQHYCAHQSVHSSADSSSKHSSQYSHAFAGLLANLTCIQAEVYEMERDLSIRQDPLWVVPYSTVAVNYQDLLVDFQGLSQVGVCNGHMLHCCNPVALAASCRQSLCGRLVVPLLVCWLSTGDSFSVLQLCLVSVALCAQAIHRHLPHIHDPTYIPSLCSYAQSVAPILGLPRASSTGNNFIDGLVCSIVLSCTSTADCMLRNLG